MVEEVVEQPKKKRGRPRKENPYREFQDYIQNEFIEYCITYKNLIESFINHDERLNKTEWNEIYNHVNKILYELNDSGYDHKMKEYNYRPDSKWRGIDVIRENDRKKSVKSFYENENIDNVYKGYMIFQHLKLYISESSKEMQV